MVEGSADDRRRDPVPRLTAVLALDGLDPPEMITHQTLQRWRFAGRSAECDSPDDFLVLIELPEEATGRGFVADFSADFLWRPQPAWTLTLGPRLSLADDEHMRRRSYRDCPPSRRGAD
jgi:hypothetical protein